MESSSDQSQDISLSHIYNVKHFETEKAYEVYVPVDPKWPKTNLEFVPFPSILAHDARHLGIETFTLEMNGFCFRNHDFNDSLNMEKIRGPGGQDAVQEYLRRLREVVVKELDASLVILYDWRVW